MPRLVAEPQGFHLSAGTGKIVGVCMDEGICVWTVHNGVFSSPVCLSTSCGLLSGGYGISVGLFPLYKGTQVTLKFMCTELELLDY